jgi:citrate synthase
MSTGTESTAAAAGLRGVVAAQSSIGDVNGEEGILIYQGYDIHDLAEHSTFEEVVFLLWNGRLPNQAELDEHTARLRRNYEAPKEVIELMRNYPKSSNPMDVLRTAVSSLDLYDPKGQGTDRESGRRGGGTDHRADRHRSSPAWERIRNGSEPVAPDHNLSIAENFLYMLRGKKADADEARMFDIALILHADHELNASTFTTRVVAGHPCRYVRLRNRGHCCPGGAASRRCEYGRDEDAS